MLAPGHRVGSMAEEVAQCKIKLGFLISPSFTTRNRSVADSEVLRTPLATSTVWMMRGRITLVADANVGTRHSGKSPPCSIPLVWLDE
jgi:hypothetical protein